MKKAFTTIELIVAVTLLAIVMVISGTIFKIAVDAQRKAGATAEITRNFRAITDQINRDFDGLVKDGFLVIRNEEETGGTFYVNSQYENQNEPITYNPRRDSIIFFAIGDHQSMRNRDQKSNTSIVYYGYEKDVLEGNEAYCTDWAIARGSLLLLPEESAPTNPENEGYTNISFSQYNADTTNTETEFINILDATGTYADYWNANVADPCENWKYFAGGVGNFKVEWIINNSDIDPNGIDWRPSSFTTNTWQPTSSNWPRAIKFTIRLYDSQGVFPQGKTFTHIVYIDK